MKKWVTVIKVVLIGWSFIIGMIGVTITIILVGNYFSKEMGAHVAIAIVTFLIITSILINVGLGMNSNE